MNKNEIYGKIERCVEDLRQIDSEEDEKIAVSLELFDDELLYCDGCKERVLQEAGYIFAVGKLKKVLCGKCWKESKGVEK